MKGNQSIGIFKNFYKMLQTNEVEKKQVDVNSQEELGRILSCDRLINYYYSLPAQKYRKIFQSVLRTIAALNFFFKKVAFSLFEMLGLPSHYQL